MSNYIQFGSRKIEYQLTYSSRKSLGITVTPDLKVLIKAPVGAQIDKIKERLRKKAPWIIKQQSYFISFHPKQPARKYIGGETHLYLGRQYRLKIEICKIEGVKLKGQFIIVQTPDKSRVKHLLKEWYLSHAKARCAVIAQPLIERFKKHHVQPSSIIMKDMATRWGSCTAKGKIILNPELIKAPKGCIEYVIIHELCHLVHHDHTKRFFELQSKEMPDWEKWKMKLEVLLA